jgi:hypothetical protein
VELTPNQKRFFYEEGYLKISGAVPQVMVDAALQTINHSLGEEGMNKEDLPTLRAQSYCKDAQKDQAITGLLNDSPAFSMVESLMEKGKLNRTGAGQIALRFPQPLYREVGPPRGHLDGLGSGLNGSAKGTYRRGFTGLAVVLLSPLRGDYGGNFTVWPKSHRCFEAYFKEHGPEILENGMPRIELPEEPIMLQGEPGDVVLAHHQIVHTAAPNTSPHIRYAAIFRLQHAETKEFGNAAYTDIWHEWPGVRAAVAENAS